MKSDIKHILMCIYYIVCYTALKCLHSLIYTKFNFYIIFTID